MTYFRNTMYIVEYIFVYLDAAVIILILTATQQIYEK